MSGLGQDGLRASGVTGTIGLLAFSLLSSAQAAIPSSERDALVDFYNQTNGAGWIANTNWNGPAGTECTWYGIKCDGGQLHVVGIDVRDNHLVGTLPSIAMLTKLQSFQVSGPAVPGVGAEIVDSNQQGQLSGPLPDLVGLTELQYFSVRNNRLSGSIPALSGLVNLRSFDVSYNQLTGSISALDGLSNLTFFAAYRNQLTGSLPDFSGVPKLSGFYTGYNQLTSSIPDLSGLSGLDTFDVRYNRLSGPFPRLPDTGAPTLYSINVSHNRLTGPLPPLPSAGIFGGVDVSFNLMSGDLPPPPRAYANTRYNLCPNQFNHIESDAWNQIAPGPFGKWYYDCLDAKVNLNQFGLTGAWYNPATSGQGFLLEGFPDLSGVGQGLFFGSWFTFDQSNEPLQQRWYSLQGDADSAFPYVQLSIYTGLGGNFAVPPRVIATKVGTALLALSDCAHATLNYQFDGSMPKSAGSIPLTRLSGNTLCAPAGDANVVASNFLLSGAWYDPQTSGQGLLLDVNPATNLLFAAWYTYAKNGGQIGGAASQRWFTLQTDKFTPGMTAVSDIEILSAADGLFDDPKAVTPQRHLGTADIAFQSCSSMTLTYHFVSGENIGANGVLNLVRIGPPPSGCKL